MEGRPRGLVPPCFRSQEPSGAGATGSGPGGGPAGDPGSLEPWAPGRWLYHLRKVCTCSSLSVCTCDMHRWFLCHMGEEPVAQRRCSRDEPKGEVGGSVELSGESRVTIKVGAAALPCRGPVRLFLQEWDLVLSKRATDCLGIREARGQTRCALALNVQGSSAYKGI